MTDIVAFISARLEEDEALAELQPPWPWHLNAEGDEVIAEDGIEVATAFALSNNQQRNTAAFIARHDPARVLREVAAKREVLSSYVVAKAKVESRGEMLDGVKPTDLIAAAELGVLKVIVRDFAAVHDEHPDYKPSWRIDT